MGATITNNRMPEISRQNQTPLRLKELEHILPPFIKGKTVLDVGCLNHHLGKYNLNAVHELICRNSKHCLGVDIEKEVLHLRKHGYNVICADFLQLNLNKKFDVVFGGEIIEHISNHKKFLEVASNHLRKNGLLILTTPNPFFYMRFLEIIVRNEANVSPHHYCYFCPKTLSKLLEDNKFKPIKISWLNEASHQSLGYLPIKLRNYFSSNFMIVARKI